MLVVPLILLTAEHHNTDTVNFFVGRVWGDVAEAHRRQSREREIE